MCVRGDLTDPPCARVVAELVARADVVACTLSPGAAARLGVDADTLRARQPSLVVAELSSYGEGGPYGDRKAFDARTLAGVLVPVLTVHGGADVISPAGAAAAVYEAAPEVESYVVDGGRHDILNDVTHRSVAATIVLFLERLRNPGRQRVVVPARDALPLATMKV